MAQQLRILQSLWAMERRRADAAEWPLQTQLVMIRDAGFEGAGVRFIDPGGDLKNGRYAPSCIYSDRKSPDFRNIFHERFRHFAAFSSIGITTEFLFVGMVLSSPGYPSNLIIDRQAAEAWRHAGAHIRANDRGKTTIGASQVEFVAGTTNRRVSMANPLIRSKARGPRSCRSAEFLLSDRQIA
jgi:hypothetical protein